MTFDFREAGYAGMFPYSASSAGYVGLFNIEIDVVPPTVPVVDNYRGAWSNYPLNAVEHKPVTVPALVDESEDELVLAMYYLGLFNGGQNIFLDPR